MQSLPGNVSPYARTPEFSEETVPESLRRSHRTKAGAWARIVVLEGRLLYRILEPGVTEYELSPERSGTVEPEVAHEVSPLGPVRFFVEFHR